MDDTTSSGVRPLEGTLLSSASRLRKSGYGGHIPRSSSDPGCLGNTGSTMHMNMSSSMNLCASTGPLLESRTSGRAGVSQAVLAIQGYRGHIPGKAEVVGRGFKVAAARGVDGFLAATDQGDREGGQARRPTGRRSSAPGVSTATLRGSIPGYTGHIPGIKPDSGLMGLTRTQHMLRADMLQKETRNEAQCEDRPNTGRSSKVASTAASARDGNTARSGNHTARSRRSAQGAQGSEQRDEHRSERSGRHTERSHRPGVAP